jgi:DNA-binding transcriptional regulator YiaG
MVGIREGAVNKVCRYFLTGVSSVLSTLSRKASLRHMLDLVKLADVRVACQTGAARSLRIAAGLSLQEVADAVGVGAPTVFRWETGERRPRGEAAIRYSEVLESLAERQRPRRITSETRAPALAGTRGARGRREHAEDTA